MSAEIFNCELNTVLEKFFEAPELLKPEKGDDDKGSDEEDEDEVDKMPKIKNIEPPMAMGTADFRPPFEGDDDAEDDI